MMIVLVHVRVKPEQVQAFKEATLENARNSRLEPGIARFELFEEQQDPCRFVLEEIYKTPEAPAAHKETEHYKKWRYAVESMMAEPRYSVKYSYADDV